MKKIFFVFIISLTHVYLFSSIIIIEVSQPIHPVSSEYICNSIAKADKEKAELLIIKLDTPGGLDISMREIIQKILNSETPVAVWVCPPGARAGSAGFFITLASDIAIMSSGTSIGAAHPVSATGEKIDPVMSDKITNDAISYAKSLASKRGRNIKMSEEAVKTSQSYTEEEALKGGLIDFIANSPDEIKDKLHNKKIKKFSGKEVLLRIKNAEKKEVPMSARQKILSIISNPNLAYILLILGMLGIYFELSNPGAIFPGVLGGICLLLAFFSFQILPINYVGLLLILLSLGLFIAEVKIQSYGVLGIGGVIAMIFGSLMLFNAPIPEMKPELSLIFPVAIGISLIFIFLLYLAIKTHRKKVFTGEQGMVGEIGEALTDIGESGKTFIHGEIWDACSYQKILKGSKIIVKKINGLKLVVEKFEE
ncbi:MAG: nodulation protein NfeD [Acidobacteriota bacterium]